MMLGCDAGEHEGRDAEPDGGDAERGHERRDPQADQRHPAQQAEARAEQDRDQDPEQAPVVAVPVVGDEERDRDRGGAHHAGDGEVDRPHHQHEGDAAGHDGEHRRRVHDVLQVADRAEVGAQDREDREDDDQRDRRTCVQEGHPPPRPGARRDHHVGVGLGGGCHGHEMAPCERLKTLSHSKSAASTSGEVKSPTLSPVIRNCSANQARSSSAMSSTESSPVATQ